MATILDVETIPIPESEIRAMLPPFDPATVRVPGNYKKPDAIATYIDDARAGYGNDIVERAALSPRFGRLAIIGIMDATGWPEPTVTQFTGEERTMLEDAWKYLANCNDVICGWNIKQFDLWFMARRSWALGLSAPKRLFDPMKGRYAWSSAVIDLMDVFSPHERCSLDAALAELGLPKKTGSGKEFPALWSRDKLSALEYNRQDLDREAAIARIML